MWGFLHTFQTGAREMMLEVIDRAEKNLNVKDKLFGHTYGVQILPVADLPEHI